MVCGLLRPVATRGVVVRPIATRGVVMPPIVTRCVIMRPSATHGVVICSRSFQSPMSSFASMSCVRTLLDNEDTDRPARRTALIAAELCRYDVDIAALSETRLADEGSLSEAGGGYTFFWKGLPHDARRIHGIGFAIRSSLLAQITESPVGINERLMTLRLPLSRAAS